MCRIYLWMNFRLFLVSFYSVPYLNVTLKFIYRNLERLYASLLCPVIRPDFIPRVERQKRHFGYVAIGDKRRWDVDFQSVSSKAVAASMSLLNPEGSYYTLFYKHILEPEHISKASLIFAPINPEDNYKEVSNVQLLESM